MPSLRLEGGSQRRLLKGSEAEVIRIASGKRLLTMCQFFSQPETFLRRTALLNVYGKGEAACLGRSTPHHQATPASSSRRSFGLS